MKNESTRNKINESVDKFEELEKHPTTFGGKVDDYPIIGKMYYCKEYRFAWKIVWDNFRHKSHIHVFEPSIINVAGSKRFGWREYLVDDDHQHMKEIDFEDFTSKERAQQEFKKLLDPEASESIDEGVLTEAKMQEQIEKVIAWFLAKLYTMDKKDAEKTLQAAVDNKEKLVKSLKDEGQLDESWSDVKKGVIKFTKSFALGTLKLGAFNVLAGLLGTSPYLVTILGNISIGIIQDTRKGVGLKKTIRNVAKRALTAAAFTLFMQMIGGGGYEHATMTGNEDSDKDALEKVGSALKRAFTGKQASPETTIEYEAPRNLGAAVREYIPSLAKNKYLDGRIVDPKNVEHFISRDELAGAAALREWDKFIHPIYSVWNKLKNVF